MDTILVDLQLFLFDPLREILVQNLWLQFHAFEENAAEDDVCRSPFLNPEYFACCPRHRIETRGRDGIAYWVFLATCAERSLPDEASIHETGRNTSVRIVAQIQTRSK